MAFYSNFYVKSWGPQWPIEEFRSISVDLRTTQQFEIFRGQEMKEGERPAFHVKARGDPKWYLVEEGEIQWIVSPEAKNATYEATCVTMDKIVINTRWVQLCDNIKGRHGILLDSTEGITTTVSLRSRLFESIIVPNFTPRFKEEFKVKDPRVRVYPGALYEFLISETHPMHKYDVCMDYCCTLYGCEKAVLPRVDLTVLFSRQLLRKTDGVLWLTFSTRSPGNSIDRTVADTVSLIQSLSETHGYRIRLDECGCYGQMCYFLYKT